MVGSLIPNDSARSLVSEQRGKFMSPNLVSFEGVSFTSTDTLSPSYQQTERVLPCDEMEECQVASECSPPVWESVLSDGEGGVDSLDCGKTDIVQLIHLHTRGLPMSSGDVYLIKFWNRKKTCLNLWLFFKNLGAWMTFESSLESCLNLLCLWLFLQSQRMPQNDLNFTGC